MEETFIISIYQKIELNDNILAFKRVGIAKNAKIKMDDDFSEAVFYDEDKKRVTLDYMETDYAFVSDDKYCYSYPVTLSELKEIYPESIAEEELIGSYLDEISKVINIAFYDEVSDKVKVFATNEKVLREKDEDELFKYFNIEYMSEGEETINLVASDFQKIMKLIEKEDYVNLKEQLLKLNKIVNDTHEQVDAIGDMLGVELRKHDKEEVEEETKEMLLEQLDNLIGLENIKESINKLVKYLEFKEKSIKYLRLDQPKLHMFFMGNPGTGKTTVARLLGKLLYKMGYLQKNTFIEVTSKDLIGEYVGQTASKTEAVIKKNKGGVIFIDEAYSFANEGQNFGKDALDVILKEMDKNETVFIFAGYKNEMEKLLKLNSGFSSRIDFFYDFRDYTKEELYQMYEGKIEKIGFVIDDGLEEKVLNNLENAKVEENFGNGRYVDKLIRKIIYEHSLNTERYTRKKELITLTKYDLVEDNELLSLNDIMTKLEKLTGLENVKTEINNLMKRIVFKEKTEDYLKLNNTNLNMMFTGNPGTGKTTVARIISELLFKLGYTKNKKFTEITTKDLIGEYVGQTGPKTANLLAKYRGGVIFLDEAYTLSSSNGFEQEALSEILKEMEKNETVFIFAGYKKEMDDFIKTNSGLTSRIGYYLDFKDYSIEQLYQMFENKIQNKGYIITEELKEKIIKNIEEAKENENFGNGRYIDKLIDKIETIHSVNTERYMRKDKLITLTENDLTPELEETLIYKVKTNKLGF